MIQLKRKFTRLTAKGGFSLNLYRYNRDFQDILGRVWDILEESEVPRVYPKSQMIYRQGETAESFYYLKKGSVRIFLSSENGMEKTLTIPEPGNIFGEAAFFDGLPRVSSAKTLEKSEIIPVRRSTLMECFRRQPVLAMNLLESLAKTVRMLSAQVDSMTFLQADKRVARLLAQLAGKSDEAPPAVSCTHEELGSLAGVSRVTVSRILADFSKRGWVSTSYRTIRVTDPAALSRFAFS